MDDRVPEHKDKDSHASSSQPSSEPTLARCADLGKHSVYTHFPKDRNCEIGFPFPPLHAVVGVAVPLTSLATTGQLVLKQECWVAEGMHWSRQPRGFAVRQGPGWAPTPWSATWICCHRTIRMGGVSKWWRTVCRCSTGYRHHVGVTCEC